MGFFKAETHLDIPNKDILSWTFDDPQFDLDQPIYIDANDSSRSISSNQARKLIRQLVAGLHAAGFQKGDCVCVHAFNDIYYSILFLGIVAAGGVFTGTNPSYTPFELTHHIKTAKAKFIISEPEILSSALTAAKDCSISQSRIWIFDVLGQDVPKGFQSWNKLFKHGERDWVKFDDEKTSKNTTAARLFSSGTTGLPKAAVISHYNLIAQHTLVQEANKRPWKACRLLCLPMFHAACVPVAHTTPLRSGDVSYVMRRFDLERFLSSITNYKINEVGIVPPIFVALVMSPMTQKYDLTSIKTVSCGAAPLSQETQARFRKLLPKDTRVNQVWGMTETSCVASMFHYPHDDSSGSVGFMLPNLDVKIVDDDGKDITAYDTRGELCIRGPTVISGYFENPTANASSFDSVGFFKTGDIVYRDGKTQKWYVVDRKKELIKVRGFQIAPPEIEGVLLSHPGIVDAAVIGIKEKSHKEGEEAVEKPRAYIVRRPGAREVTEEEVLKWCGERLAKYKELSGGIRFVEAIPKNPSGKILKRVLREQAEKEGKIGKEQARL